MKRYSRRIEILARLGGVLLLAVAGVTMAGAALRFPVWFGEFVAGHLWIFNTENGGQAAYMVLIMPWSFMVTWGAYLVRDGPRV